MYQCKSKHFAKEAKSVSHHCTILLLFLTGGSGFSYGTALAAYTIYHRSKYDTATIAHKNIKS